MSKQPLTGLSTRISTAGPMRVSPSLRKAFEITTPYRQPVEYNNQYYGAILRFSELQQPYRYHLFDITTGDDLIDAELRRFSIALDAYAESNNPLIDIKYLWHLAALGPEGAVILKRIKRASILKTFETALYESDPELLKCPAYVFTDIGQIFNYAYLPFWIEPDDKDYLEGFTSLDQDSEYLEKFRNTIKEILPDDIEEILPEEILMINKGTSCFHPTKKGNTSPYWKVKESKNSMGNSIGPCLRCVIPKGPQDTRDAVITSVEASNRITWMDRQLMEVLSHMGQHIHLKSQREIQKRISRLGKKFQFYVHRDIKKEGITKPRTLLKIMLEELDKKYHSKTKAFECHSFYDSFCLQLEAETVFPVRGHGLGMANSLTTLMNIAIYTLAVEEDNVGEVIQGKGESLSLNDDFVAAFETEEDSFAYQDKEQYVMAKLGIIFAPKKSFPSQNKFVIAEEYWPRSLSKKESYKRAEVLNTFACMNIMHAKELCNSVVKDDSLEYWNIYKTEIIDHWGYEFFPNEALYPYSCGGWVTESMLGVSLDLLSLDQLPYNNLVYRAFKAVQTTPSVKVIWKKSKEIYKSPLLKVLGNLKIRDDLKLRVDCGFLHEIQAKYTQFRNVPAKAHNAFAWALQKRQKTFKQKVIAPTYLDFIEEIISNVDQDFYPTEFMTECHVPFGKFKINSDIDPYVGINPLMSALKCENPHLGADLAENYSLLRQSGHNSLQNFSKASWLQSAEDKLLMSFGLSIDWKLEWINPTFQTEEEESSFGESYVNPIMIANISNMMGLNTVPIPKVKYRNPILKEREKVFTNLVPISWYPYLSKLKLARVDIKALTDMLDSISAGDILTDLKILVEEDWQDSHKQVLPACESGTAEPGDILESPLEIPDEILEKGLARPLHADVAYNEYVNIRLDNQMTLSRGGASIHSQARLLTEDEIVFKVQQRLGLSPVDVELLRQRVHLEEMIREAEEREEAEAEALLPNLFDD
jgi:hypothetical protein